MGGLLVIYSAEPFARADAPEFSVEEQRVGLRHRMLYPAWQEGRPVVPNMLVAKCV